MGDFIPSADGELVNWLTNYKAKLSLRATDLGLDTTQVDVQKLACDNLISAIGTAIASKKTYDSAMANKKQVNSDSVKSLRNFIKNLKTSTPYTDAVGNELGIVATTSNMNNASYKSVLKADLHPGYVLLKFTKKGAEGINLYTRIKGETDWVKIGFFGHSPCTDARPLAVTNQAENREYMCIGLVKDHEIGVQSDIVSMAFAG
jgi:hypothetical protein